MNKEILFRAKRRDNGQWVRGSLLGGDGIRYIVPGDADFSYDEKEKFIKVSACEICPETICRYTGMSDRNGRKIWEHDFVKAYEASSREWMINEVVFEYGCFKLAKEQYCDSCLSGYMSKNMEVTGNSFDTLVCRGESGEDI